MLESVDVGILHSKKELVSALATCSHDQKGPSDIKRPYYPTSFKIFWCVPKYLATPEFWDILLNILVCPKLETSKKGTSNIP
jgi:hypothetical protein